MTSVAAVVLPQGPEPALISMPEWHSVCTQQHNALLEGPPHATEGLLMLLQPYLRTPTIWKRGPMPLEFPIIECGALVLPNVAALERHEQAALLTRLDAGRTQVVSTTAHPLFPLIARGLFNEALYYRLSVMRLSIDSTGALV